MTRVALTCVLGVCLAATSLLPAGASATPPASVNGVVQSGGTSSERPLAGVRVTLYEAAGGRTTVLDQAGTAADGGFDLHAASGESRGVFYVTADVARGVTFAAVLGPRLPPVVTVNELTTVAAGYATAQVLDDDAVSAGDLALRLAAGMNDNIVDTATGTSSEVLLSSPNADQTNSLRSTRSLANLLAACIGSNGVTSSFLALTKPHGSPAPDTTLQALANLARDPGKDVQQIYRMTKRSSAFTPALESQPDAWTLVVKVNDSGSDVKDELFGGPGNLAFDARGYAWVTNNVVQGETGSSSYVVVLQPDGRPADGTNGTPSSPLDGGGILGTGYGVTIGRDGSGWFGNFGWGGDNPTPGVDGSVSQFSAAGVPLSVPNGYVGEPNRVQGMATDAEGNIWMASFADDSVYVFLGGDPDRVVRHQEYRGSQPFDIAIGPDGSAWVSNGFLGTDPGSVSRLELVDGKLHRRLLRFVGRAMKGISVDSQGNAWVASLNDNAVYGLRPNGSLLGPFARGGIYGPWDVTVDGEDNLYGAGAPPSFIPMMRQTASVIDRAGNVWTINNYKPNFDVDATVNPGGDGILIFVGLAPPARR